MTLENDIDISDNGENDGDNASSGRDDSRNINGQTEERENVGNSTSDIEDNDIRETLSDDSDKVQVCLNFSVSFECRQINLYYLHQSHNSTIHFIKKIYFVCNE